MVQDHQDHGWTRSLLLQLIASLRRFRELVSTSRFTEWHRQTHGQTESSKFHRDNYQVKGGGLRDGANCSGVSCNCSPHIHRQMPATSERPQNLFLWQQGWQQMQFWEDILRQCELFNPPLVVGLFIYATIPNVWRKDCPTSFLNYIRTGSTIVSPSKIQSMFALWFWIGWKICRRHSPVLIWPRQFIFKSTAGCHGYLPMLIDRFLFRFQPRGIIRKNLEVWVYVAAE